MFVSFCATWTTIVSVLTSKNILTIMRQFTSVNWITPRIWHMTVTWQLIPSFGSLKVSGKPDQKLSILICSILFLLLSFFPPFFLSFFLPSLLPSFLPFFLSFFLKNKPRVNKRASIKKRGSIEKWRLDWKMEARLENGGSIEKWRLDWKIEARLRNRASFVAEWQNEVSWSF